MIILIMILMTNSNLVKSQIADRPEDIKPLLIGSALPNAELKDQNGNTVHLNDILAGRQTVLVFYRGNWCPFCNMHLSALAKAQDDIVRLGYQIVAISPDDYQNLIPMINKDSIHYTLFSDPGGKLIQQAGLAFKPQDKLKAYIDLNTLGTPTDVLPVPALMIVNEKTEIVFEYINPDIKHRITKKLLMAVLNNLH